MHRPLLASLPEAWGGGGEGAPAEEAPRPLRPSPAQRSQPCGPQRAAEELSLLPSALE